MAYKNLDLTPMPKEIATLKRKEIAKLLGVSTATVAYWAKGPNPIPHVRRGGVIRYNLKAVLIWWEDQRFR